MSARRRPGPLSRIAPPRFLLFLALLVAATAGWRWAYPGEGISVALAMGFDLAAAVFLVSLVPLWRDSGAAAMRRHAAQNDANRIMVLVVTTLLTLVVTAAIAGELPGAKSGDLTAIIRLIATLLLTWLFANSVYALHYAHAWYSGEGEGGDRKGLDFPGTVTPEYNDFAYFAFTLGMTFQTSDVAVTSSRLRTVVLLHSFAAFLFNLGVIAFTLNALGGN